MLEGMAEGPTYPHTYKHGERIDYHMLRTQWKTLFDEHLGQDFACLRDSTAYGDEYIDLFTMHFGH